MDSWLITQSGEKRRVTTRVTEGYGVTVLTLPRRDIPEDTDHVDFCPSYFTSGLDEAGYLVIPRGTSEGSFLYARFRARQDTEYVSDGCQLPVLGFCTGKRCCLARVTGLSWDWLSVAGVRNGVYYAYPRFYVDPDAGEDPQVTVYHLPVGSTYADLARFYRAQRLREGCRPLRQRAAERPALRYAAEAMEVRIRCAWKPCPSPVETQTPENEPPVHPACDFARSEALMDAMSAAGIRRAELCYVGFECKGHDGRWPQLFPVEETLGGESALRRAIAHGQSLGYQVTAHTNSTCSYAVSEDWNEDNCLRNRDGSLQKDPILWSGGRSHLLCPTAAMGFARRDLPRVAALGFRGLHYVDVLTNFPPRRCYSPLHPLTRRQAAASVRRLMDLCTALFGGFASEGAFDFAAERLDYVLYTSYNLMGRQPPICDRVIPFWQLVYHGIVLYNPSTETVNYCVKPAAHRLKCLEFGGRPLGYLYSRYVGDGSCGNWMGEEDLRCGTPRELADAVSRLAAMQAEYETLSHLQYAYMDDHRQVSPGVFETAYSDGTVTRTDYTAETFAVVKGG